MPESQPNYLTISDTGDTSALFSGGLQLIAAGPAGFSDPTKGVSWIRDPVLGGLAASIVGVDEDLLQNRLDMRAYNAAGDRSAAFSASADATTARVSADVGGTIYTIIDSDGESDFLRPSDIDTVFTGPIAGTGIAWSNGAASWVSLTNLRMTYTTPNTAYQTTAKIDIQARVDSTSAAWLYAYVGLNVSPVPLARMHGNGNPGGGAFAASTLGLGMTHSAGQVNLQLHGFDTMTLAPNTAYTFQVLGAGSGVAGTQVWGTAQENSIMGTFWPKA